MNYKVLRAHDGDRSYQVGDVRELDPISAHDLLESGYLGTHEELAAAPAVLKKVTSKADN